MGEAVVYAQAGSPANDRSLGQVHERRPDLDRPAFDPGSGRDPGQSLKRRHELGATVRITGVVQRIGSEVQNPGLDRLGQTEGDGQEHRIAGRNVGHRNAARPEGILGNFDRCVRQRGTTHGGEVDPNLSVVLDPQGFRHPPRRLELEPMALAIIHGERHQAMALVEGDRGHRGRIKPSRQQYDRRSR